MLILVSTPIGNLGDISPRACEVLAGADIIACEDTRQSRKLIQLTGIQTKASLIAYHDHNGEAVRPRLLKDIADGKNVALVSDAGTPLISDPGYKLVLECHTQGLKVTAVPGPSSPIMALSISGLPSDKFTFNGFVPTKTGAARIAIEQTKNLAMTQIWFETPNRLATTIIMMAELLGNRMAVITRELTKLHEEVERGYLEELAQNIKTNGPPKGELVLLVAGNDPSHDYADDDMVRTLLAEELPHNSLRDAVRIVEKLTLRRHKDIYQIALRLKQSNPSE